MSISRLHQRGMRRRFPSMSTSCRQGAASRQEGSTWKVGSLERDPPMSWRAEAIDPSARRNNAPWNSIRWNNNFSPRRQWRAGWPSDGPCSFGAGHAPGDDASQAARTRAATLPPRIRLCRGEKQERPIRGLRWTAACNLFCRSWRPLPNHLFRPAANGPSCARTFTDDPSWPSEGLPPASTEK